MNQTINGRYKICIHFLPGASMASGTTKDECLCLTLVENLLGTETKNDCHSHEAGVTRKELKSYDLSTISKSANFQILWGRKINSWG